MQQAGTDSRSIAVMDDAKKKSQVVAATTRHHISFRKLKTMPFRLRLLLFCILFAALLVIYTIGFLSGAPVIADVNAWTDSLLDSGIHLVCATAADITGDDWSGRELALSRLLLLGPLSYTILSFLASIVATGVVAIVWSAHATLRAEENGTSNFIPNDKYSGKQLREIRREIGWEKQKKQRGTGRLANAVVNVYAKTRSKISGAVKKMGRADELLDEDDLDVLVPEAQAAITGAEAPGMPASDKRVETPRETRKSEDDNMMSVSAVRKADDKDADRMAASIAGSGANREDNRQRHPDDSSPIAENSAAKNNKKQQVERKPRQYARGRNNPRLIAERSRNTTPIADGASNTDDDVRTAAASGKSRAAKKVAPSKARWNQDLPAVHSIRTDSEGPARTAVRKDGKADRFNPAAPSPTPKPDPKTEDRKKKSVPLDGKREKPAAEGAGTETTWNTSAFHKSTAKTEKQKARKSAEPARVSKQLPEIDIQDIAGKPAPRTHTNKNSKNNKNNSRIEKTRAARSENERQAVGTGTVRNAAIASSAVGTSDDKDNKTEEHIDKKREETKTGTTEKKITAGKSGTSDKTDKSEKSEMTTAKTRAAELARKIEERHREKKSGKRPTSTAKSDNGTAGIAETKTADK